MSLPGHSFSAVKLPSSNSPMLCKISVAFYLMMYNLLPNAKLSFILSLQILLRNVAKNSLDVTGSEYNT